MNELERLIKDYINKNGPITFEQYMEEALYHPSLGYYTSGKQRVGPEGDFYTAPYASSVMSMIIAKQIAQFFELLGKPDPFYVVEFGAGTGRMADDIIESLITWHKDVYERVNYIIVETGSNFDIEHKEKIKVFKTPSVIKPFTGCIISNELFDALPVHIIVMKDRLYEVYVDVKDDQFVEVLEPASDATLAHIDNLGIELTQDVRTEINLRAGKMLETMASILMHGYVLTIDYGYNTLDYYSPDRTNGTLMCYYKHQADDNPYELSGEKDLTSHVDFTNLAKKGLELSLEPIGYVRQMDFIYALGYEKLLKNLKEVINDPVDYFRLTSASKFLIMPGTMGEIFKVMLQYKGGKGLPVPSGFTYKNMVTLLFKQHQPPLRKEGGHGPT
ncbi:MAG: SAM-dependent methyltransferase [Deltaproteobacteria bacterium]|nr:SAM-dependent methyltransferase [Deltaproteobacteria bacterium]MCL5792974.1 SAM-dependent methyltransferase [Deltaproteobacteria bacterium]